MAVIQTYRIILVRITLELAADGEVSGRLALPMAGTLVFSKWPIVRIVAIPFHPANDLLQDSGSDVETIVVRENGIIGNLRSAPRN